MSSTKTVGQNDWAQEVLQADKPVLVVVGGVWWGAGGWVGGVVEEVATEHAETLKVVKLNIDENPDIARQYKVLSIPTLMVFKGGQEAKRLVGARGKTQLVDEVSEYLA